MRLGSRVLYYLFCSKTSWSVPSRCPQISNPSLLSSLLPPLHLAPRANSSIWLFAASKQCARSVSFKRLRRRPLPRARSATTPSFWCGLAPATRHWCCQNRQATAKAAAKIHPVAYSARRLLHSSSRHRLRPSARNRARIRSLPPAAKVAAPRRLRKKARHLELPTAARPCHPLPIAASSKSPCASSALPASAMTRSSWALVEAAASAATDKARAGTRAMAAALEAGGAQSRRRTVSN